MNNTTNVSKVRPEAYTECCEKKRSNDQFTYIWVALGYTHTSLNDVNLAEKFLHLGEVTPC